MTQYRRFLCFAVTAGFWGIPSFAQSREAEGAKVYSAAFDFLFGQYKGEAPRTIVLMDSTSWDAASVAYNGVLRQPHSSTVDPETIKDFEALNRQPILLTKAAFSYRLPIVLLTLKEFFRLDTLGRRILKQDPWSDRPDSGILMDAFAAQFPHAWGITVVSQVGFNNARTQAMVLVANNCGNCFHSETLVFRKRGRKWAFQERIPFVSLDGPGPGETRYLGANPQFLPRMRRVQDSTRKAIADSIARRKLPRRIRGTVTNRQTGRPIPFAQVLLFGPGASGGGPDSPPRPTLRVVANRRGRYTISNPPIGVAMLVFLCPGPVYFDHASFGAPGLYVFPGTDTTFDFVAQNLSACWAPTKVHQLASGWLESAEARNATVPDDEERKVFAAVISHLQASMPNERIVGMYTRTMLRCRFGKRCGSVQLSRLVHDGLLDASTASNFKTRSATASVLNPGFAQSHGLHVVTDQEFHYYSGEATWPLGWPAQDAERDSIQFWISFRKAQGNGAAILSLTRAGFDSARREALVEVRTDTGYVGRNARLPMMMLLRRTADGWTIADDNVGSGVTSGAWEGETCVATAPSGTVKWNDVLKLRGEFLITVVSTAGNLYTRNYRVHIGRNVPRPVPSGALDLRPGPFTFEARDEKGNYNEAGTLDLSINAEGTGIPRNSSVMMLDGYHHALTIRRMGEDGFFGSFSAGVFVDDDVGHFCARRISSQ